MVTVVVNSKMSPKLQILFHCIRSGLLLSEGSFEVGILLACCSRKRNLFHSEIPGAVMTLPYTTATLTATDR
jgi:hypothetical protein